MRLIDADKLKQDDELMLWLSKDAVRTGKMLKMFSELFVRKIDEQPTICCKYCKWIPVSEKLPEENGRYLTYIVNEYELIYSTSRLSYMMVCDYINGSWFPDDETSSNNVTHWMSLPAEPYEKESEE